MPLTKFKPAPGFFREGTVYTAEGKYYAGDKVRFRFGLPEKIGGWTRYSNAQFTGTARALINWIALSGENVLGIGTHLKYMIEVGGTFTDITPIRSTTTAGEATFAAVNGSTTITVTDLNHGAADGDYVTFSATTTLGGNITAAILNAEYKLTFIGPSSYSITSPVAASAGDVGNGGANTIAQYQINTGQDVATSGVGWGAGTWPVYSVNILTNPFDTTITSAQIDVNHTAHGRTTGDWVYFASIASATVGGISTAAWIMAFQITVDNANKYHFTSATVAGSTATGVGSTVSVRYPGAGSTGWGSAAVMSVSTDLRLWSHDTFGEDLIFNVRNGGVYYYDYSTLGVSGRAVALSALAGSTQAPTQAISVIVSAADRHIIAFGCDNLFGATTFDPLLIRWADAEDATQWLPSPTNSAGDLRLTIGSGVRSVAHMRQEILIWTDTALYSMQYIGAPFYFSATLVGATLCLMGPNSFAVASNNVVYWMAVDKFYMYDGVARTLPCTLRKFVFDNMNQAQGYQCTAGTNEAFNEVWFFYVSLSSGGTTVDSYVVYNYVENLWYSGSLARTVWLDGRLRSGPMAADYNSSILTHEIGVDDVSGLTPAAIDSFIETGDFDIGDGDQFTFIRRILPDINFLGSTAASPSVELTLTPRRGSGGAYVTETAKTVTATALSPTQLYTNQVDIRVRGRQMKLRIENNTVGTQWQSGDMRFGVQPDGKR